MKILFIAKADLPDYQSDMVFHGGRSLFGADFVDANRMWYMYKEERVKYWNQRVPNGGNSYGRGMTLHGKLEDIPVDRSNIEQKIKDKYFDYVIYGSIERCHDHIQLVSSVYPKNRILIVNGEDHTAVKPNLMNYGVVFKRELVSEETEWLHPINFCIPEELVVAAVPEKTQDWATVIPGRMETYVFFEEEPYYKDYQKSYFGLTHKKGGWDCLRHYEILMNGCIPYFPDLKNCPENTMKLFPKSVILESNTKIEQGAIETEWYNNTVTMLLDYTKKCLTTKALVNKMLEKL